MKKRTRLLRGSCKNKKKIRVTREPKRRIEMLKSIDAGRKVAPKGGYFGSGRRRSDDKLMPAELKRVLLGQHRLRDSGIVFEK